MACFIVLRQIVTKNLLEDQLSSSLRQLDFEFGELVLSKRSKGSAEELFKIIEVTGPNHQQLTRNV